jgi:putative ABC transport system substrate-binding protein
MRRRDFIKGIIGSATAWPLAAHAQQLDHVWRVAVLMGFAENDPVYQSWIASFRNGLSTAGWADRNLQIEDRWVRADVARLEKAANEIIALKPDVIFASTTPVVAALKRKPSTIPIVFATVSDPVGNSFVESLAHPGGNITGFIDAEGSMGGKWLNLLKEVAPALTHAAMMFNPDTAPGRGGYFLPSFEDAGRKLGLEVSSAPVHDSNEIERTIFGFAESPSGGLVMMSDTFLSVHRDEVIKLTQTHKLPVVWGQSSAVARAGGLLSYFSDPRDAFSRSAGYVDRILKGEKPANLPVQTPNKFDLAVNLKTARALGLTVPQTLLATADEVIE